MPWDQYGITGWGITYLYLLLAGIFFGLFSVADRQDKAAWQAFNAECLRDHKQYECTAMWRTGETSSQVVPIVIPTQMMVR